MPNLEVLFVDAVPGQQFLHAEPSVAAINDTCAGYTTTDQHTQYISHNLSVLKQQCVKYQQCLGKVYSSEKVYDLFSGEDIQLRDICGLLYGSLGQDYTKHNEQCPEHERDTIRTEMDNDFLEEIDSLPNDVTRETWANLSKCIETNKLDKEGPVATVCRLSRSNEYICNSTEVHDTTQIFFNNELEDMYCSCQAVQQTEQEQPAPIKELNATTIQVSRPYNSGSKSTSSPNNSGSADLSLDLRITTGAAVSAFVVIIIVVVVLAVFCYKYRKAKTSQSKQKMTNLTSADSIETSAIYQEIRDSYAMIDENYLTPVPALPERPEKTNIMTRSKEVVADPRRSTSQSPAASTVNSFGQERAGRSRGPGSTYFTPLDQRVDTETESGYYTALSGQKKEQ